VTAAVEFDFDFSKPTSDSGQPSSRRYVQRVELTLALPDQKPLASLGLNPDPLQQLATAMASVRTEAGEGADVILDLVPLREHQLSRRRRQLLAQTKRRGPSAYGESLTGGLGGLPALPGRCVAGL
jgi:hypothetical protein